MPYQEKKFDIPDLKGLSAKQVEVHLGLYSGYVKHVNLIREKIVELEQDKEKNSYLIAEILRRFAFEFNGMRMHEYYFDQFVGGHSEWNKEGNLAKLVSSKYGSPDAFIEHLKAVAMSRGIGWAVLYHDPMGNVPHTVFVGDHELGQLAGLPILIALDMWEHAYMVDYTPSEKKQYIDAFLANLNWNIVEERMKKATAF